MIRPVPMLLLAACALAACGGAKSHTRFGDPATLLAERDEWRGDTSTPVVLRLHVEALVDTRPDPSQAQSALIVQLVAADFTGGTPIVVSFPVPRHAKLTAAEVRLVDAASLISPGALPGPPVFTDGGLDPEQRTATVTLPAPPTGGVVEAILRFTVPGTLTADARHLGLPGLPVGELLLRYDLASDTVGTFQTTLPDARPVVTDKDGRRLIALFVQRLAPAGPTSPLARYVTVRASPKGYDQTFAADWAGATAGYRAKVVDAARDLDDGYEVPYRPTGTGRAQVLDALAWVRGRPLRDGHTDPFDVRWDAARKLPEALTKNDLTAVDRVHLLHWVLREAGVAHGYLMARAASRPPLDPAFPTPGAFDAPLIHVPSLGLVLDPACDTCAPGEVRPSLRGGQALAVPVPAGTSTATFLTLPTASPAP